MLSWCVTLIPKEHELFLKVHSFLRVSVFSAVYQTSEAQLRHQLLNVFLFSISVIGVKVTSPSPSLWTKKIEQRG